MSLQGELATLELADIVQNIELHKRNGTLAVETPRGPIRVYFERGAFRMLASPGRPDLLEDLVAQGLLAEAALERARKARWRTRKALVSVLAEKRLVDADTLRWFGERRLQEDVCDFLLLDSGAFRFVEEGIPRQVFDPEERALEIALPVGPLLFEAARRKDHWPLIRSRLPADGAYYQAVQVAAPIDAADPELAQELLERLDGTSSVRELLRRYPARRFEVYEHLARLAEERRIRTLGADDLVELALGLADREGERAWQVVLDGLAASSHHLGLLRAKAKLALVRDEPKQAAEARKVIAHLCAEGGDRAGAARELEQACELDPEDPGLWERRLELAREAGNAEESIAHGLRLVALYRAPGMHTRACEVLEELCKLDPERYDLERELARSRADCGNSAGAAAGLERFGKKLLAREDYKQARRVQEEILRLLPGHKGAQNTLEQIDGQVLQRRRRARKLWLRRAYLASCLALILTGIALDLRARADLARTEAAISTEELIERRRYGDAIALLASVRARHPYALASYLDVRRRVQALEHKLLAEAGANPQE
jgi:hypothetical protein